MKKEELIIENTKLGQANKELFESDLQRRKVLSEMLSAPFKKSGMYDYNSEQVIYGWPDIYFHLGKLVAKKDYADFSDTLSRHERDISDLFVKIAEIEKLSEKA